MSVRPCVLAQCICLVIAGCTQRVPPGAPEPSECTKVAHDDAYWPMEVGAVWTYVEHLDNGLDVDKVWTLMRRHDDIVVLENTGLNPRRVEVELEGDRVVWRRKMSLDPDSLEPLIDTYFVPRRVRLDPSLSGEQTHESSEIQIDVAACGDAWSESADLDNLDACPPESKKTKNYRDTWSVATMNDVEVPFEELDMLCQTMVEEEDGVEAGTKTFCWARGVGKVWEYEAGRKTEELDSVCFP